MPKLIVILLSRIVEFVASVCLSMAVPYEEGSILQKAILKTTEKKADKKQEA